MNNVRLGWVRHQVDTLNGDNVLVVSLVAELQRRVAGDLEVVVRDGALAEKAQAGLSNAGGERDKKC